MGQYYYVVNLDKKEFLHPHKFGDGLNLLTFGSSGEGTMLGLAVLLANSNNRGGGDLQSDDPLIGSWAGDRIVVAGDYAKEGDAGEYYHPSGKNLNGLCDKENGEYKDISYAVMRVLCQDSYIKQAFSIKLKQTYVHVPDDIKTLFGWDTKKVQA